MGMFDMLGKLGDLKAKMEEMKKRLDDITVTGESAQGKIAISISANRKVRNIYIDDKFINAEHKQEFNEQLTIALAAALDKANNVAETEMKAAGKDLLPNIPGLF